jgi:hypothetical protein
MVEVELPLFMLSSVTFSEGGSQRLNGPQPSKKGRMPGPAGEGKGAECLLVELALFGCKRKSYLPNSQPQSTV